MGLIDTTAEPITVTRFGVSTIADGYVHPGASDTFDSRAAVQPARPNELLLLPEGQRTRGAIRLYSEIEIRTADEVAGTAADVVTWEGKEYEVHQSELMRGFGMAVYKALAVRKAP